MAQNDEKRNYPRIPREIAIQVSELTYPLPVEPGDDRIGKDIGGGGICFISPHPYDVGKTLCITMHIKGWEMFKKPHSLLLDISAGTPLNVIGLVVWSREQEHGGGYEIGIKFLDIYEDDHRALLNYIEDSR